MPVRFRLFAFVPLLALLLGACVPPPLLLAQAEPDPDPWRTVRLERIAAWRELRGERERSGLERFAHTVQDMLDDAYARSADPASPFAGLDPVQLFLDDLVDVFVSERYQEAKTLIMASPSRVGSEVIVELNADRTGFRADLQLGDGRFRHFAMNAAAAYRFPPFLVAAAARWLGGDSEDGGELSADSRADLATNAIGREFARLLRTTPPSELADGVSVERWLLDRFGP